jgi:hypothetical protein
MRTRDRREPRSPAEALVITQAPDLSGFLIRMLTTKEPL